MAIISDYNISKTQSYNKNCICKDMQLCTNPDSDTSAGIIMSTTEVFGKKSELLHTSVAVIPPQIHIVDRETASWIVSGLLIFYITMLVLAKKYIPTLGIILFSKKNHNLIYNDFSRILAQTSSLFAAFSVFIVSIFLYLVEKTSGSSHTTLKLFAIIVTIVCIYIILKLITIKIIGYISENEELKSKLFAVEIIILSIYGLFSGLFLTLCFSDPIQNINIWLAVISAIIILLYLFKISKIIMIFIDEKISSFFLILYLCAIEILPMWLIIDFL
jgi:hypothetical protein